MSALAFAAIVFGCTFGGGLLGIRTRMALPAHHLNQESKDLVRICMGLVATMTALILGLVTASAKAAFDAQDAALHASAADILILDRNLASFGADAQPIRAQIREALSERIQAIDAHGASPAGVVPQPGGRTPGEAVVEEILALSPQNDAQRWRQAQALSVASEVLKNRWFSLTGSTSPVATSFLAVVVFWLGTLFWSFGLFAPRNPTVIAVLLLSALSVSACVLLILEMQTPFTGMLRVSSAPLHFALEHVGG